MEKANGEAAHASVFRLPGSDSTYLLVGSKNVHMLLRVSCPDDVRLYVGPRFKYAGQIAETLMESMETNPQGMGVMLFHLLRERCTAIFEYEDPLHAHIVPLYYKRLKFITLARVLPGDTRSMELSQPPHVILSWAQVRPQRRLHSVRT
jgi:hypothetical protein